MKETICWSLFSSFLLLHIFAMAFEGLLSGLADAAWCVCKSDLSDAALQKTLDYACGAGADCSPVLQNGACYSPNTVKGHCSYATNSYFQRQRQAQGACDFSGTATLSATDPSQLLCLFLHSIKLLSFENVALTSLYFLTGYSGCTYPATARYHDSCLSYISRQGWKK